jgi:hypothetical protein
MVAEVASRFGYRPVVSKEMECFWESVSCLRELLCRVL